MDIATTKIDTITRAKKYFQAMGCSSFHMSREYPDRYHEYRRLAISEKLEREWTCEAIACAATKLNNRKTRPSDLWHIHSQMEDLVQQLQTVDTLWQIYETTERIVPRLPKHSKVLVAETIVGRSHIRYRSGLVFLAYDLNEKAIFRHFSEIANDLATLSSDNDSDPERRQAALDTCEEIRKILGFN